MGKYYSVGQKMAERNYLSSVREAYMFTADMQLTPQTIAVPQTISCYQVSFTEQQLSAKFILYTVFLLRMFAVMWINLGL
jgi:hypothetical protein